MAQKLPRFSVVVMAMYCVYLSLAVVARESTSPYNVPRADVARKYVAVHHHMHPGSSSSMDSQTTLKTSVSSASYGNVASKRYRNTRETFPVPHPTITSEEPVTGSTTDRRRNRRMQPEMTKLPSLLVFVPLRGRRYGVFDVKTAKRQHAIEQMLEKGDYFVPNRGKKSSTAGGLIIKKGTFDVLLGSGTPDEYFFPNRGKKEYFLAYEPIRGDLPSLEGKLDDSAMAPGGDRLHPVESRLRRNLLENLANEHKDTFFSSRGKRIVPVGDEIIIWPVRTQPVDRREENFSGQSSDVDTLLLNDAVSLLPLNRPPS